MDPQATTSRRARIGVAITGAACIVTLGGCLERLIEVTSEPPGALVTINDAPVGRTPLQTEFLHYGDFDVRVELAGFETIREKKPVSAPLYELPPIDFIATALPVNFENIVKWHFVMQRPPEVSRPREEVEKELLDRAAETKGRMEK